MGTLAEEYPPQIPEPLSDPVLKSTSVESDHASNSVTRRSHTGILFFVCNVQIKAFSKRYDTVEYITFGSELVAIRIATDIIVELRIKLKSTRVPLKVPTDVYCDNQVVVKNTRIPKSTLNKNHNNINHHVVREAATAGILQVGKEDTATNLDDPFTKLMPY